MEHKVAKKKLVAAQEILNDPKVSLEKFAKLRELLYGLHPSLDEILHVLDVRASELGRLIGGDFLAVSLQVFPETAVKEIQNKQLLVEFWNGYEKLKVGVAQALDGIEAAQNQPKRPRKPWHLPRFMNLVRGLPGLFILLILFVIALLQFSSATISIVNNGCHTITPSISLPQWIPGLSIPRNPIPNGGIGDATVPGLTYSIDGTERGEVTVKAFSFSLPFDVIGFDDIMFDGVTILGRKRSVSAFGSGDHILEFVCHS